MSHPKYPDQMAAKSRTRRRDDMHELLEYIEANNPAKTKAELAEYFRWKLSRIRVAFEDLNGPLGKDLPDVRYWLRSTRSDKPFVSTSRTQGEADELIKKLS
jgi:hypothetical protein